MNSTISVTMKPYIQPFEKVLAIKEFSKIFSLDYIGEDIPKKITIPYSEDSLKLLDNLAYWLSYSIDNSVEYALQVKKESTTNLVRNGISIESLSSILPFNKDVPVENRRNLRYGSHGIHEYRGKFFPQLVKSLLNIAEITSDSIVLDPMCGSGTTLVESAILEAQSYGTDLNPLSVFLSKTKCEILSVKTEILTKEYELLKERILKNASSNTNTIWINSLRTIEQTYLAKWFSKDVLIQLDAIKAAIDDTENSIVKDFFLVILSNIIRTVSWQKNDDLRVRLEIRDDIDIDVYSEFIIKLNKSYKIILSFLFQNNKHKTGNVYVKQSNVSNLTDIFPELINNVDTIITSPPYATSLPYLDTDRLSLYYLGLLSRKSHRNLDLEMVGNREITKTQCLNLWDYYQESKSELTIGIVNLIDDIYNKNINSNVGFRRKNLPPLLSKYFFDMKNAFSIYKDVLKKGSYAFIVVGNNHTIAGGEKVMINTNLLLAELGEASGLKLVELIPMEMLTSRDIFKKNASNAETIIVFRKE